MKKSVRNHTLNFFDHDYSFIIHCTSKDYEYYDHEYYDHDHGCEYYDHEYYDHDYETYYEYCDHD